MQNGIRSSIKVIFHPYHLLLLLTVVSCSDSVGENLGGYSVPVERIFLNKDSTSILTDNEEKLYVTFSPADASNQSVFWSSSDDSVASVDNTGVVKGITPGMAEIKAVSAEGHSTDVCKVTITTSSNPVSNVVLNKTNLSIDASETETLFAGVFPSDATGQILTWESSDTSVAEVTDAGLVTAKTSGTAIITVKTSDGKHCATCEVSVSSGEKGPQYQSEVTGISLNRTSLSLSIGKTDCLVATVLPANARNRKVIWISDNPAVVSVSSTGALQAEAAGYARITVISAEGSFSEHCDVYVGGTSTFTRTETATSSVLITPGGIPCKMIITPNLPGKKFPVGDLDSAYYRKPVPDSFTVAETETTYELWKEVYNWATDFSRGENIYVFSGKGMNGGDYLSKEIYSDFPATNMTWRDAIIWCNALTEYYNMYRGTSEAMDCVYYSDPDCKNPIRDAKDSMYDFSVNSTAGSVDNPYVKNSAKGFRLPRDEEWEFAARYIGPECPDNRNIIRADDIFYTDGNSASGARSDLNDVLATSLVSVFWTDFESDSANLTKRVRTKAPNSLGLYDMSGNIEELCFNWHKTVVDARITRGGSALHSNMFPDSYGTGRAGSFCPYYKSMYVGFRFVRSK